MVSIQDGGTQAGEQELRAHGLNCKHKAENTLGMAGDCET